MQNRLKSAFESAVRKSGAFFQRQQWKEIFIFMLFLLLSFVFWFLQTLQLDYEQRIMLPLRYRNVPAEWALSEDNPKKVSVLVKEKGTNLLYYIWNGRFNPIDISVSGLSKISDMSLHISTQMLETELSKQLIASTSILSFEPREIELHYDLLSSRIVPVSAQVTLSTKPGFQQSESITVSHREVRLFGSIRLLETLREVKTKPVVLEKASKTKEVTAQLDLPAGIRSEIESVKVTIPIEEFTEKKVRLPVQCPDIPENYVLRLFPSSVEVTCPIPLSQFRELTADKLEIIIPYRMFSENQTTGKIPVRVTQKPSWVINPIVVPDELEFIIEYHD
jgi:YbbR domain-containing protein